MSGCTVRGVLVACVASIACLEDAVAQASVDSSAATPTQLANRLEGPGVTITNPAFAAGNGSSRSNMYGLFSNGIAGANLSIDTGVVLTTGTVADALGPNNDDNASRGVDTQYSDPDLTAIDPLALHNVAILRFDLTLDPYATGFEIGYQFGSDEYPDYVGSRYNDVFAFFLSGPGISGTQNIATAPLGGSVSVNNINIGTVGCYDDATPEDLSQSAFYINNGHTTALPATCQTKSPLPGPFPVVTEYNGLTTLLKARAEGLTPGATYAIKFAIADVKNRKFDSGVFIELVSATYDVDHGDAPAGYGTPTHDIRSALRLGAGVTGETSAYADPNAAADANDDGVTLPTLVQGATANIEVSVNQDSANEGYLQGWVDWNGDGDFADAGEQIATNLQSASAGTSTISVPVTVPTTATTSPTFARFRWSSTSGINSTTAAPDGEVEDYQLTVSASPPPSFGTIYYPNSGDGDYPGSIAMLDWGGSGLDDGIREGDRVTFALPGCRAGTLTATFSNVTNATGYSPTDMNTWSGSSVHLAYNSEGSGEALYGGGNATFRINWSLTVNGVASAPDIVFFDAEATTAGSESIAATTNGAAWAVIDEAGGSSYNVSGIGTQSVTFLQTQEPSHSPVLLSKAATQTDVALNISRGLQGVAFGLLLPCDYGDALSSYADAGHAFSQEATSPVGLQNVAGQLFLGTTPPDAEVTGQSNSDATGDNADALGDDEDGVTIPVLTQGQATTIPVSVTQASGNSGYLQGWIDWNGDGDFADAGEQIATNLQSASAGTSTITVPVTVPTTATTSPTFARFRWSTMQGLDATSAAPDGEIEDYALTILAPPTLDFDADDSSGTTGADYATSYAAGDGAVNMTDTDVSITDADDTTLTDGLTATLTGFIDTGNEIVTIGGAAFTIGTPNVPNVVVGNTTFEIDSDGGDFGIVVVAGTGEIADWEALFASITYENTSATPTPGDRVLGFSVTDPNGGVSNVASSTLSVNATPTDLALSFDPLSGTPVIGFPYSLTLNLQNESAVNATGVAVSFPLPAGWAYVSDDTGGNYDPATGLLTVGQSNAGVTETVEFSLVPLASGPYDLTAEVSAANETDVDSTPGNGVVGEDDQAGLAPTPQLGTGTTIPAQTCSSGSVQTLDWDSATWAAGNRNASFSYAGISVDIDITDPQGALDGTPNGPMPAAGPFYQGGLASVESTLIYETNDADLANGDVLTTISFGQAVDEVRLSLFDIDFSALGPRLERIEIRGFNGASAVPVILDGGPAISINGAEAVGVDESDPTGAASGDGTVSIAFDQPVDRVEIDYGHAPGTDRSGNPGHPGFALHDISFCGGTALLTGSKSVTVYTGSATNPDLYAIPGEDVIYAITVTNTGTGPSDADTIKLIDAMPPEVTFFNGATPEFGGAVIDWDETGTGLSFTPATDLAYSNSTSGAPDDFSACTYTPLAGYDPDVAYVCFNPKGAMAAGSDFTISFRARIE